MLQLRRRFQHFTASLALGLGLVAAPLAVSAPAYAVDVFQACSGAAAASSACKDAKTQGGSKSNPILGAIKATIHILSIIIGVASVLVIIVSGLRMTISNGDAQAAAQARKGIIFAAVGLFIVLFAQAIVAFVLNKF